MTDFPANDFKYVTQDVALSAFTTFKIGGKCAVMIDACSVGEIKAALLRAKETKIPLFVLGNGSNVLFSDEGFNGVVLHLGRKFAQVRCEGESVFAEAGASVKSVFDCALHNGLGGAEFLSTIPASVGGAIFMNAGCFGSQTSEIIKRVWATDGVNDFEFLASDSEFGYRSSVFQKNGLVITKAEFALAACDKGFIRGLSSELMSVKRSAQPLEYPSAGSIFKRPEGAFAGQLIDRAELKGFCIGGACVSEKHAGFIVNKGGATAADVIMLMQVVKEKVQTRFGVILEPEVQIIGNTDDYCGLPHTHEV